MKKWCELSLKGDETASTIVLKLISNDFKISDWIVDISLGQREKKEKNAQLFMFVKTYQIICFYDTVM